MYEENDGQNGNQNEDQGGPQTLKAKLLQVIRPSGLENGGDFVRFTLRVDPATGKAYRTLIGATAQAATGPNGQDGQNGQRAAGESPAYTPPIQTRNAQGKTLSKYRMGVGQRILASVANFANGFAGNGADPVFVGPGALNNRYYQDEALRQQQNDELQPTAREVYLKTVDWRTIGQDPVTKKWYGKTYGGQKQEVGTPPWAGAEDDTDNNDDASGPPPIGAQVGSGQTSARGRFNEIRKGRVRR